MNERIYLGGFEIYREYDERRRDRRTGARDAARHGRQAAHRAGRDAHAGQRRLAGAADPLPVRQPPRLGQPGAGSTRRSSPTRSTTPTAARRIQAGRSAGRGEPKRYRYTGKERDEESGSELSRRAVLRAVAGAVDGGRSDAGARGFEPVSLHRRSTDRLRRRQRSREEETAVPRSRQELRSVSGSTTTRTTRE